MRCQELNMKGEIMLLNIATDVFHFHTVPKHLVLGDASVVFTPRGFKFRSNLDCTKKPSFSSFSTDGHCMQVLHFQLCFQLKCPAQLQNLWLNFSSLSHRHVAFCTALESNWSQCKHRGWGIAALQTQTQGFAPPSSPHWHEINYKAATRIYSLGILPT